MIGRSRAARSGFSIGLEFDHESMRAARIRNDAKAGPILEDLVDTTGDYSEEAGLLDGLRQMRGRLRVGPRDRVASCISGKQVFATEIPFRRLPPEDMESALRLELRKSVPFELEGSALEYQILGEAAAQGEPSPVLVAVTAKGLLEKHLKLLERAGLSATHVDVLPVVAGNVLWHETDPSKGEGPSVAIHIGPQIATIIIDGPKSPFFFRHVYFAAEDFAGRDPGSQETSRQIHILAEEVSRSLGFYEKSAHASGFQEILLMGEYLETANLGERLRRQTSLPVRKSDLCGSLGRGPNIPQGRFDLAAALALAAGEE